MEMIRYPEEARAPRGVGGVQKYVLQGVWRDVEISVGVTQMPTGGFLFPGEPGVTGSSPATQVQ